MKRTIGILIFIAGCLGFTLPAAAHYGMVIPSDSMVMQDDPRSLNLKLSFSHPFERIGMELIQPKEFGMVFNGQKINLTGKLSNTTIMDQPAWELNYTVKQPGVYLFYMEPRPYWEKSENGFIVHYTKTVVAAFGDEQGWDVPAGLKTEIVPLTRPFGLYAGNVFQGKVLLDDKPVPHSMVEIEYHNENGAVIAPTDYMITQTVKADDNGIFTVAVPVSGWWGFAALNTSGEKIKFEGEEKDVELGAVIWVFFHDRPLKERD